MEAIIEKLFSTLNEKKNYRTYKKHKPKLKDKQQKKKNGQENGGQQKKKKKHVFN